MNRAENKLALILIAEKLCEFEDKAHCGHGSIVIRVVDGKCERVESMASVRIADVMPRC